MVLYVLFEHASGLGLFKISDHEEIGANMDEYQRSAEDFGLFARVCQLAAFRAFASAEEALDNILQLSEGQATQILLDLLATSLPKGVTLGVGEERLAVSIQENSSVKCEKNAKVAELLRGVRLHFAKFVSLTTEEASRSQLGLGHSYSRSKVKFNVNRVDNMIIQSIALIDQIDKDLNTFAMRCREWYSWHFPELYAVVQDNVLFAKLVVAIGDKGHITPEKQDLISAAVNGDANISEAILHAAKHSMGMEIADVDLVTVVNFAQRVSSLAAYRLRLHTYLRDKMNSVAPNLAALIGEMVGARLISHAGSLTSLAKYPASTVQILGAEKALFRALKAKGNTPKYGLIFHSSFIGKASSKNKGRISRYLANKCSIASRLDCFSDVPTDKFGAKLREQVEERLAFYEGGAVPRKNVDVMREVLNEVQQDLGKQGIAIEVEKKRPAADDLDSDSGEDAGLSKSAKKQKKKEKKEKKKKDKKGSAKKEKKGSRKE